MIYMISTDKPHGFSSFSYRKCLSCSFPEHNGQACPAEASEPCCGQGASGFSPQGGGQEGKPLWAVGSCQEGGEENIPELLTQKLPVQGTLMGGTVSLQHFTPLSREMEISDGLEDLLILSIYFKVLIFGILGFSFR